MHGSSHDGMVLSSLRPSLEPALIRVKHFIFEWATNLFARGVYNFDMFICP